ncbi:MAG TPA: hypothetical protein VFK41_06570 [Nocardioidaceae bacterium]|nr:hypothetical protein [Nocardioidaceae bacterium]
MTKLLSRAATGAVDVALFGAGLLTGTVRAVVHRIRGGHEETQEREDAEQPEPWIPAPRDEDEFFEAPPAEERQDPEDVDVITPVGTTGAGVAYNPSTAESDLQQPGTEPLMDPSTTKRIKAETDILRKAAERNPD